jgi:hypothetical protein
VVAVAIEQLEGLTAALPAGTRVLADRWYATGPFVSASQRLHLEALVRLKKNRKLYRPAPARVPGKRGAPRKDGNLFQGSKPQTWGAPDADWQGTDQRGNPIQVQARPHLHFQQAQEVELTVYRVLRLGAKGTRRDPRESWFIWIGAESLPLEEVVSCGSAALFSRAYLSLPQARSASLRKCMCARHSSSSAGVEWWQRP